jgi:valyl-tRNA synthetase
MPHLTEELASRMGYLSEGEFLMNRTLPSEPLLAEVPETASRAEIIYQVGGRLRNLKAEYHLAARKDVRFVVKNAVAWLEEETDVLAVLVGAETIEIDSTFEVTKGTPTAVTDAGEFVLPLEGLIDVDAEKKRLEKEIAKVEKEVEKSLKKLQNPKFVENAKPEVVAVEKDRHGSWLEKLKQLRELHAALASE